MAKRRRDSPAAIRRRQLKFQYGITVEEYDCMVAAQGGLCGICGQDNPSGNRLSVDHNHETGEVRGLLCHKCNVGIGLLGENVDTLEKAKAWLARS